MTALMPSMIAAVLAGYGSGGARRAAPPVTWPDAVCRESSLEWATGEDGVARARLSRDVNGDGRADTLEASSSGGSGMSSTEVELSLSGQGEPIEVSQEVSFYRMYDVTPVPPSLLGAHRRQALEMVEEALFGRVCERADPSLAWLLASPKRIVWIAGAPRMPETYTVRLSRRRLDALSRGRSALERAVPVAGGGEVWVTYRGRTHTGALPPDSRGRASPAFPVELARDGARVLLGTGHGAILTDVPRSRHAWIYVHEDPEHAQKLRLASIVSGRLTAATAEIGVDRLFLGGSTESLSIAPVPVRVDLRTGRVSHAFDGAASTALARHESLCEQGVARECVLRDQTLCDRADAASCYNAAVAYSEGKAVPRRPRAALDLFERACKHGSGEACYEAAWTHAAGQEGRRDYVAARSFYLEGCVLEQRSACTNAGVLLLLGQGVPRDIAFARSLFSQACDLDDAAGCYNLGQMYESGDGVARDTAEAGRLYAKACGLGAETACAEARRRQNP